MHTTHNFSRRSFVIASGSAIVASLVGCAQHPDAPQGASDDALANVVMPTYNLEGGFVTLNNGIDMPAYGLGTYALSPDEAAESVYWAIESAMRLIDTAKAYDNEEGVGRGIAQAIADGIVAREELFVTTKLWQDGYSEQGVQGSLDRMGLDYVDLLFVHQAMGDYQKGYDVVVKAQQDGLARCIGLSNFTDEQFAAIVNETGVIPQVAQYESHLHLQRHAAQGFLAQYGVQLEGWFPLGGKGNTQTFLTDPVVTGIAESVGRSAAQVIERWHLQEHHVIMPGSHNRDHIRENVALFDFELSDEDMAALRALDQNRAYYGMVGTMSDETLETYGGYLA